MKKSLLVYAAVPATSLPDFDLLDVTPRTVNGSGSTMASVSVTASIAIGIAEGGAMIEFRRVNVQTGRRNFVLVLRR